MIPIRSRAALAICALLPLAAQAEPSNCRYTEVGSLPLRYGGPGLEVTTEGSINGLPATMLVDTGSDITMLTSKGVEQHKLPLHATSGTLHGVGGDATVYRTQIDSMSAGPARTGSAALSVVTDFGSMPSFDAVVGAPFLLQTDMELSLATKELRFFRPSGCDERFLAYWDPAAMVIPFEASSRQRPNPRFTVLVNGRKMQAMIDTGASSTVIGLKAARRAGLKLDAPGVTRAGYSSGFGAKRAARWNTTFDKFQIGEETVLNAEVGVVDWEGNVDVLLGADFLRAHRVLFAMNQRKLYISYVGGEPFAQRRTVEPWMQQEAEAGNADAQFRLATAIERGDGVPKDAALAASWMEKAARGGSPQANLASGRRLMLQGFPEDGAARIRSALDKLPSDREAALWLYIARVRTKQPDLARTELAANFARNVDKAWPEPIADFYLGKITADALLKTAGAHPASAKPYTCQALGKMAEWHHAHGERERGAALVAQVRAQCARPPAQAGAAGGD